jgi:hypothetical protein
MNLSTAHMQTQKTVQDPDQHGFHFIYVTKVSIARHAIIKGPMLQMTKVSNQEKEHSLPRVCAYVCWNLEQDRKGRLVHGGSERWEAGNAGGGSGSSMYGWSLERSADVACGEEWMHGIAAAHLHMC